MTLKGIEGNKARGDVCIVYLQLAKGEELK